MLEDLYIKPVDNIMQEGQVGVVPWSKANEDGSYWRGWQAHKWVGLEVNPRLVKATGDTPREAIIALFKELSK